MKPTQPPKTPLNPVELYNAIPDEQRQRLQSLPPRIAKLEELPGDVAKVVRIAAEINGSSTKLPRGLGRFANALNALDHSLKGKVGAPSIPDHAEEFAATGTSRDAEHTRTGVEAVEMLEASRILQMKDALRTGLAAAARNLTQTQSMRK